MLRKINCTLKRTEASSLGGSAASEPFSLRRGFYLLIYASVVTVVSCFGFMTTCSTFVASPSNEIELTPGFAVLISTKSTDFVTGEANGTEFAPIIFLTALYALSRRVLVETDQIPQVPRRHHVLPSQPRHRPARLVRTPSGCWGDVDEELCGEGGARRARGGVVGGVCAV